MSVHLYVHSKLKHHAIQTILHELLVDGHELGGECLKVVDRFVAQLQSVFVEGGHVSYLCLQLAVAVTE